MVIVYLGGAMGVQAWLMKGFFDTIPDGARRVRPCRRGDSVPDLLGRRAAARRAGARRRRTDLLRLHAERVHDRLGAPADEQPLHAAGRDATASSAAPYDKVWGPFTAGALLAALPVDRALPASAAVHRQRSHSGLRQGMTAPRSNEVRARSSTSRITTARTCTSLERPAGSATRPSCASASRARDARTASSCRYERDGEPRNAEAFDRRGDGDRRLVACAPSRSWNPIIALSLPAFGRRRRLRLGERPRHDRRTRWPDADDFADRRRATRGQPGISSRSSTRSSPTVSRRPSLDLQRAGLGDRAAVG